MAIETITDYFISGVTDPTDLTEGTVGKFYKNTNTNTYWVCTKVYTEGGITKYQWKPSMINIYYTY